MWFFNRKIGKWQNYWNDWEWIWTSSVYYHQSRRLGQLRRWKGMCRGSSIRIKLPHWENQDEQARRYNLMSLCIMMIDLEKLRSCLKLVVTRSRWLLMFWMPFLLRSLYFLSGLGNWGNCIYKMLQSDWLNHRTWSKVACRGVSGGFRNDTG